MGLIFDIQRGCTDDGPGIRTTVFLKGCPLNCIWCHNPESRSSAIQCYLDHSKSIGYQSSAAEIMNVVRRDLAYYQASGGGITLSGGEPLMQPDFAFELLSIAAGEGIHTCIETSGYTSQAVLASILPVTDLFLYDIKAPAATHKKLTGADNTVILKNLDYLYRKQAAIILRCPMIPTLNDSDEHFAFLRFLKRGYPGILDLQLMPYHNMGIQKSVRLGETPGLCLDNPGKDLIEQWHKKIKGDEK